jgi:phosphomevalonate kinase
VSSPVIQPASITILADDSYYTQPGTNTITAKQGFSNFGVKLSEAHKTGLGSSAALVTALTAALLVHYLPEDVFSLKTDTGKSRLHNLAQTAHCAAQGKVGSVWLLLVSKILSIFTRRPWQSWICWLCQTHQGFG